jgi:hypothetical protein
MLRLCAIVSLLTIIAPLPGLAYTQEDADACTPDAFRLCGHVIPDADRVASCLASNKRNLSPACKLVFSRPATASEAPAPGRRPGRPLDIHRAGF